MGRGRWRCTPREGGKAIGILEARWIGGRRIRRKGWRKHAEPLKRKTAGKEEAETTKVAEGRDGRDRREPTNRYALMAILFCILCGLMGPLSESHGGLRKQFCKQANTSVVWHPPLSRSIVLLENFSKRQNENIFYWEEYNTRKQTERQHQAEQIERGRAALHRNRRRQEVQDVPRQNGSEDLEEDKIDAKAYWARRKQRQKDLSKSLKKSRLEKYKKHRDVFANDGTNRYLFGRSEGGKNITEKQTRRQNSICHVQNVSCQNRKQVPTKSSEAGCQAYWKEYAELKKRRRAEVQSMRQKLYYKKKGGIWISQKSFKIKAECKSGLEFEFSSKTEGQNVLKTRCKKP